MQIKLSKYITIGLYATLLLPLLYIPGIYLAWNFGKIMVFQILVEALLILWLINLKSFNFRQWLKQLNWLDWSLIIFVATLILTSATGINFTVSFWGNFSRSTGAFTWLHFLAWYFLLKYYWQNNNGWKNGFNIAIIVGLLVSLTIFLDSIATPWQSIAGGGIIGNRAFASAYLIIALGLSGYLAIINRKLLWRLAYVFSSLIYLIAIVICGIRGAYLGLLTAAVVWLVLLIFYSAQSRVKKILVGILITVASLLVILFAIFFGGKYKNSSPILTKVFDVKQYLQGTGETRLMAWQIAWQGIKAKPIFGYGPGNYEAIYSQYYNPQFLKFGFSETVWDKPHNWLLEIGSTSGLLGILSYLFIFICAECYIFTTIKKSPQNSSLNSSGLLLVAALLVGYFAQNLFLFETSASMQLWFLLLAFISGQTPVKPNSQSGAVLNDSKNNFFISVLAVVGSVIILGLMWKGSVLPLKAGYYLQQGANATSFEEWANNTKEYLAVPVSYSSEGGTFLAEQFIKLDKAGANLAVSGSIQTAINLAQSLSEAASIQPLTIANYVWAGQIYLALGEKLNASYLTLAETNLKAAANLSPNKQDVLFLLGRLYLIKKEYDNAYTYLNKAVIAAPDNATSHWFYGLALVTGNKINEGIVELESAISLGYTMTGYAIDQKLYVLDLYTQVKNYDKVIQGYQSLLAEDFKNVNWYVKLASAYVLAGDKAQALSTINKVSVLFPFLKNQVASFIKQNNLK